MSAHPEGWHENEEMRQRCWGCSHPEKLEISPEDEARARQLIADGFMSTSNKYCMVARVHVPKVDDAFKFADDVPHWLRLDVRRAYEIWVRHGARMGHREVEQVELPASVFRAFKRLGGEAA